MAGRARRITRRELSSFRTYEPIERCCHISIEANCRILPGTKGQLTDGGEQVEQRVVKSGAVGCRSFIGKAEE